MAKRLTTKDFISKAREAHGDRFDYSQVKYTSSKTKVRISCSKHGWFEQIPYKHLSSPHGCPHCSGVTKKTTDDFVAEASEIHGDRFDYSRVIYRGNKTKVKIICTTHGEFEQTPVLHISGKSGCPKCSGKVKKTTAQFIDEAKKVHGEKFDYSKVNYKNNATKVEIVCPTHGSFSQLPTGHLQGNGCPKCIKPSTRRLSKSAFIERARATHGNKYDYSLVEYTGQYNNVRIICPTHGEFSQTPKIHFTVSGCGKCGLIAQGLSSRNDTESFIAQAKAVHGEKYDYSKARYVRSNDNLIIICPEHGEFNQTAKSHVRGSGCSACGGRPEVDTSDFITRAKDCHGEQYDYSKSEYVNAKTMVTVICPEHGPFEILPSNHTKGVGCSGCAGYGFDSTKPGILYYLRIYRFNQAPLYKIGITNRSVEERFTNTEDRSKITVLSEWHYEIGSEALSRETNILRGHKEFKYIGAEVLMSGNSELFTKDILGLDISYDQ
jgi:hypothetical protein